MNIVITGNTKGIGLHFTREFLKHGDAVVICSRTEKRVDEVVNTLSVEFPGKVYGTTVDVTNYEDVKKLGEFAVENLGSVDIWINNAGTSGGEHEKIHQSSIQDIDAVIKTNVIGTLYGCRVAINIMLQQGDGNIFNMEGFGSDGRTRPGLGIYGTSKRSIPYLTKALVDELKGENIGIHSISPGMVLTDLLLDNADAHARKIFNILAEHPTTVAKELVPRIRATTGTGNTIKFLTTLGILWRFLTAWRRKNRFFDEDGNYIHDKPI